ncbi:hypothetical protein [Mycetocola reblochoni]|uniref:hypothetical protein n=1 Tax=Mycetocola reblochoni TaxID=331618 RepID=UPI00117D2656|nr:hypothetical protein [Mycetocola reblochoni]
MRKIASTAALVLVAFSLTGCAQTSTVAEDSQPNEGVNVRACDGFAKAFNAWRDTDRQFAGATPDERLSSREAVFGLLDEASLEASGDVKERMNAVLDAWPADTTDLVLVASDARDEVNTPLKRVATACSAAGASVELTPFSK